MCVYARVRFYACLYRCARACLRLYAGTQRAPLLPPRLAPDSPLAPLVTMLERCAMGTAARHGLGGGIWLVSPGTRGRADGPLWRMALDSGTLEAALVRVAERTGAQSTRDVSATATWLFQRCRSSGCV
jgi:hypothetical protein